jgi:hypothetical protein
MGNPSNIEMSFPVSWGRLAEVRAAAEQLLQAHSSDARDAVVMAALELAENVIKYGEPLENDSVGSVRVIMQDGQVTVVSTSGVSCAERGAAVVAHVERIAGGDPMSIYVERLQFLAENPHESATQLGLCRVAFEGEFALSASYEHPRLVIEAQRSVST